MKKAKKNDLGNEIRIGLTVEETEVLWKAAGSKRDTPRWAAEDVLRMVRAGTREVKPVWPWGPNDLMYLPFTDAEMAELSAAFGVVPVMIAKTARPAVGGQLAHVVRSFVRDTAVRLGAAFDPSRMETDTGDPGEGFDEQEEKDRAFLASLDDDTDEGE